jgi:putative flippase GtrA
MKIIKYFFVGGAAAAFDITFFFIFAKLLEINYFVIGAIGFALGTLINYCLSIAHVFDSGSRFGKSREIFWIFLISLVGLAINQVVLFYAIGVVGIEVMLGKIAATSITFFWNYSARKYFVFKS